MGYTHYWYRKPEIEQGVYSAIVADFKKLLPKLAEMGVKLGNGLGRGNPIVTDSEICFNGLEECGHPVNHNVVLPWPAPTAGGIGSSETGISGTWFAGSLLDTRCCNGDCSYETFSFDRMEKIESWQTPENGLYFNCCKTAFRPYDLAVISFLIIAKHHLKDELRVVSDGGDNEWFDGKLLCQMELGYGQDFQID